jgi:hypothetical protein
MENNIIEVNVYHGDLEGLVLEKQSLLTKMRVINLCLQIG